MLTVDLSLNIAKVRINCNVRHQSVQQIKQREQRQRRQQQRQPAVDSKRASERGREYRAR